MNKTLPWFFVSCQHELPMNLPLLQASLELLSQNLPDVWHWIILLVYFPNQVYSSHDDIDVPCLATRLGVPYYR